MHPPHNPQSYCFGRSLGGSNRHENAILVDVAHCFAVFSCQTSLRWDRMPAREILLGSPLLSTQLLSARRGRAPSALAAPSIAITLSAIHRANHHGKRQYWPTVWRWGTLPGCQLVICDLNRRWGAVGARVFNQSAARCVRERRACTGRAWRRPCQHLEASTG